MALGFLASAAVAPAAAGTASGGDTGSFFGSGGGDWSAQDGGTTGSWFGQDDRDARSTGSWDGFGGGSMWSPGSWYGFGDGGMWSPGSWFDRGSGSGYGSDWSGWGSSDLFNRSEMDWSNVTAGNWSSGNWSSGDWLGGDRSSGDWSNGNWSSGDWSGGDWTGGDWSSGDRSSGDWTSGNWSGGDWTGGDWTDGDWTGGDGQSDSRFTWRSGSPGSDYEVDREAVETAVHEGINEVRQERGLEPLEFDDGLREVARYHSGDMAENDYFSHTSPSGETMMDRYQRFDYECRIPLDGFRYATGAENIFMSSTWGYSSDQELADAAVEGWMNSDGHRRNILDENHRREGIGVAVSEDGSVYITQNFC